MPVETVSSTKASPSLPPGFVASPQTDIDEPAAPPSGAPPVAAPGSVGSEVGAPPAGDDGFPPEPELPRAILDPNGVGAVVPQMSAGSMRTGRIALGILTGLLDPQEQVEGLVQGVYQSYIAIAALTDTRVLLVNEQEWVPRVRSVPLTADLVVQGWQDDRTASLIFLADGQSITFSGIADRPLAQEFAHRLRARVAGLG